VARCRECRRLVPVACLLNIKQLRRPAKLQMNFRVLAGCPGFQVPGILETRSRETCDHHSERPQNTITTKE
jgi:hypothetical protein